MEVESKHPSEASWNNPARGGGKNTQRISGFALSALSGLAKSSPEIIELVEQARFADRMKVADNKLGTLPAKYLDPYDVQSVDLSQN